MKERTTLNYGINGITQQFGHSILKHLKLNEEKRLNLNSSCIHILQFVAHGIYAENLIP
jgi:hypothetical protein